MNTEIETENEAFVCPPLPVDLQAQCDQLLAHRQALLNNEPDSDEVGELMIEAERIKSTWYQSCEKQGKRERSTLAQSPEQTATQQSSNTQPIAAGSSQPKTKLAEYLALKTREEKGEVLAGSAFAFWRQHKTEIHNDRNRELRESDSD